MMFEKSVMTNIQEDFAVGLLWFEFGFQTGVFKHELYKISSRFERGVKVVSCGCDAFLTISVLYKQ